MPSREPTDTEKRLLAALERHVALHGSAPTHLDLAKAMGWAGNATVSQYLARLRAKGLLPRPRFRGWRNVDVGERASDERRFDVLGVVHAGPLSEAFEESDESVDPGSWLAPADGECFFLKVTGDSMVRRGIHDGDMVLVRRQNTAAIGQVAVARVDGLVTLKELARREDGGLELRPWNPELRPIAIREGQELEILGVCVGLMRNRI